MRRLSIIFLIIVITFILGGCNNKIGTFYILKDAYERKLISKEDLKNIAYYYNSFDSDIDKPNIDSMPTPTYPETINKNTEKIIKKMYLEKILKDPTKSIKGVKIYNYYGTYNESIALGITDNYHAYDYVFHDEYIIDGIIFYHFYEAAIRIFVFD